MGDSTRTLELEVKCSMGDMTNVVRGNEMVESSSWIVKECWWKGTLKKGMVRQGTTIENWLEKATWKTTTWLKATSQQKVVIRKNEVAWKSASTQKIGT